MYFTALTASWHSSKTTLKPQAKNDETRPALFAACSACSKTSRASRNSRLPTRVIASSIAAAIWSAGFCVFLTATVDSLSTVVEGPKHEGPPCRSREAHHEPTLVEILVRRARQVRWKARAVRLPEQHLYTPYRPLRRRGTSRLQVVMRSWPT